MHRALLALGIFSMAVLAPAFVAPQQTLQVSHALRSAPQRVQQKSGSSGLFSAGVAVAATVLAGRRRGSSRVERAPAVVMEADKDRWNRDKGIPFNYKGSLKLTPPKPPKRAMERRKSMWLKWSIEGNYKNRKRNCFRIAKQAVMKSLKSKYRSRRLFKRTQRQLWVQRVGNNSKLHGIPYNQFICKLKEANININRKILSQLGVYDRAVFTNVLQTAVPNWKELKEIEDNKGKTEEMTVEELDNYAIPYFEATIPELYTDPTIRFNRQVKDWGVEYTIDMGDPEEWRDQLPKLPELANFQLPDHMLTNSRRQLEEIPVAQRMRIPDEESNDEYRKFMDKVRAFWKDEEEKKEKGEEIRAKKEGVSRESWFDDEPQTWF